MSEQQSLCCLLFSVCKNNLYAVFLHISIKEGETIQAIWFPSLSFLASWNRNFQTIEIGNERYSKHVYTCLCFSYSLYKEKKITISQFSPMDTGLSRYKQSLLIGHFHVGGTLRFCFSVGVIASTRYFFKKTFVFLSFSPHPILSHVSQRLPCHG